MERTLENREFSQFHTYQMGKGHRLHYYYTTADGDLSTEHDQSVRSGNQTKLIMLRVEHTDQAEELPCFWE